MTPEDIVYQAGKLHGHVLRGGDTKAWFRSKDFDRGDRRAILGASTRIAAQNHDPAREIKPNGLVRISEAIA